MVKSLVKTSALMAASALLSSLPALAQVSAANVRALNVARNWAVNNNGGLSVYRPAACMFNTGTAGAAASRKTTARDSASSSSAGGPVGWNKAQPRPPKPSCRSPSMAARSPK